LAGLTVDRADVSIAGSGDAVFASDGEVSASIMGSGNITVRGALHARQHGLGPAGVRAARTGGLKEREAAEHGARIHRLVTALR